MLLENLDPIFLQRCDDAVETGSQFDVLGIMFLDAFIFEKDLMKSLKGTRDITLYVLFGNAHALLLRRVEGENLMRLIVFLTVNLATVDVVTCFNFTVEGSDERAIFISVSTFMMLFHY